MNLGNLTEGDSSTDEDQSDDAGVSYLYIRAPGHSSNGEGHSADARDQLRGEGEFSDTVGVAQACKKYIPGVKDQHDYFSQIVSGLHTAINENDYSDLFETLMVDEEQADVALQFTEPSAQELGQYLDENEDVTEDLVQSMHDAGVLEEVLGDDEESDDEAEPQPAE